MLGNQGVTLGRLITDNALFVFETFHYIKKARTKNKGFMGIKLDITKAYDSLEWHFIENTITVMGFPTTIINNIMQCIRFVSFSIIVNGTPTDSFQPQRGIMQGDPLSPYIFICCTEVLFGLITKSQQDDIIHGISIATNAPSISHLLYAEDNILFCRAQPEEAHAIMSILQRYQRASGQKVNLDKLEMIFSPNISMDLKLRIHANLLIKISDSIKKYLDMPTQFGMSKEHDFSFILDRIWSKVKGWKEKCLSFEGRGVLIRAVAQGEMSLFCDKIKRAVCSFWWGGTDLKRKIHRTRKENLFKYKH